MKTILATTSPHRIKAFQKLDLDFITEASNVDEYTPERPGGPKELVKYLAKLKAEAVIKNHSEGIVIGFDSVGYFNGKILEKPQNKEESISRLKTLSNNTYSFYTGIYMFNLDNGISLLDSVKTELSMKNIDEKEIIKYLKQDSKYNTYAHGYDPLEHYSSTFVKEIKGSWSNVLLGIPLSKIMEMLFEIGYKLD
jgi:septum formation protein